MLARYLESCPSVYKREEESMPQNLGNTAVQINVCESNIDLWYADSILQARWAFPSSIWANDTELTRTLPEINHENKPMATFTSTL